LQNRRARCLNQPFAKVYVRRLIVLIFIGIVHGLFFFAADILAFYAVVAFIALPFRNARTSTLLRAAIVFYCIGLLFLGVYVQRSEGNLMPQEPNWRTLVEDSQSPQKGAWPVVIPVVADLLRLSELDFYEFMADEQRIFAEGTWLEMVGHRAVRFSLIAMPLKLVFVSWRVLGLFLLGMYFVRRLTRADATEAARRCCCPSGCWAVHAGATCVSHWSFHWNRCGEPGLRCLDTDAMHQASSLRAGSCSRRGRSHGSHQLPGSVDHLWLYLLWLRSRVVWPAASHSGDDVDRPDIRSATRRQ
jgi:uncharacterized membrane protein YeiB